MYYMTRVGSTTKSIYKRINMNWDTTIDLVDMSDGSQITIDYCRLEEYYVYGHLDLDGSMIFYIPALQDRSYLDCVSNVRFLPMKEKIPNNYIVHVSLRCIDLRNAIFWYGNEVLCGASLLFNICTTLNRFDIITNDVVYIMSQGQLLSIDIDKKRLAVYFAKRKVLKK